MNKKISEEEKDKATCWICYDWMEAPITLKCAHSFCQSCIVKVYRKDNNCSYCRRPIQLPLPGVNEELEKFVSKIKTELEQTVEKKEFSSKQDQDGEIFNIPSEIFSDVILHLDVNDIGNLSRTCTLLNEVCEDNWIWREKTLNSYPFHSVKEGYNWKTIYKQRMKTKRGWTEGKSGDFKVTSMRDHKKYINCLNIFKRNIITGGADSRICLWRMSSRASLYTLTEHTGMINDVKFNEMYVISGSNDHTSHVWDTTTGTHISKFELDEPVKQVDFYGDCLVSSSNCIKMMDLREKKETHSFCNVERIDKFKFSDDEHLTVLCDTGIKMWDLRYLSQSLCDINNAYVNIDADKESAYGVSTTSIQKIDFSGNVLSTQDIPNISNIQVNNDHVVVNAQSKYHVLGRENLETKISFDGVKNHLTAINSFCCDNKMIVGGMADNTVRVHNLDTGEQMYLLLGGSLQAKKEGQDHPTKPGCSKVIYDETRVIGTFGNVLKVYQFGA